jgi:hypothetical protein
LAANGSVITAGTNITISGGTIASTGGSMAIGGTITSATAGSVLYAGASGVLAQTNPSFYYDYTNNRLGIGTATPTSDIDITKSASSGGSVNINIKNSSSTGEAAIIIKNDNYYCGFEVFGSGFSSGLSNTALFTAQSGITELGFATLGSAKIAFRTNSSGISNERMSIFGSTGNIGINTTTDAGFRLDVNGTARVQTSAYFATTSGSVGIGTTTVGSTLQINGNVAIGYSASTAAPTNGLAVSGNISLNTTLSSWPSTFSVLQIVRGSIFNSDINGTIIANNQYYNGSNYVYIGTAGASFYEQYGGGHNWYYAASGTSGNTVSNILGMTMSNTGRLGIFTANTGSNLQLNGNCAIGYSASTSAPSNGLQVNGRGNFLNATDNSLFSLNSGGTLYTAGFSPNATANSTNTLTLTTAQTTWIYNGTGVATWTLYNPSGTNQMIWIKNAGTGIITLNAYSGTNIINNSGSSVSSITIAVGATALIQQDGNVKSYQLQ